jgi:hypothetical protein
MGVRVGLLDSGFRHIISLERRRCRRDADVCMREAVP